MYFYYFFLVILSVGGYKIILLKITTLKIGSKINIHMLNKHWSVIKKIRWFCIFLVCKNHHSLSALKQMFKMKYSSPKSNRYTRLENLAWSHSVFWQFILCRKHRFMKLLLLSSVNRGMFGVHHISVKPDLRLKLCSVVIIFFWIQI